MNSLLKQYGSLALVAGASEGIGAAFSRYLAAAGMNLVLVARRKEPLQQIADSLAEEYHVQVTCISCDLSDGNALHIITEALAGKEIHVLVYNAAFSFIGHFEQNGMEHDNKLSYVNMITPMNMIRIFGIPMLKRGKGAIIMMSSLAGFQGSGFLAAYASTRAFIRVLSESLWYEWKNRGVDVIACCAGATSTPNYIKTKPEKVGVFAPRIQTPQKVVEECMKRLGKKPSIITGCGNKFAGFIMQRLLPRKSAINIMGNNTRKIYRL